MSTWKENNSKIILLDNGSYEIKHSKPTLKKNYKFHNAKFFDKSSGLSHYFFNTIFYPRYIYQKITQKKIFPQ